MKKQGKDKLTNEEMDELCEKIKAEEQEGFRLKAMQLFNVELPPNSIPKRVLQKAYIRFSTVSSITESNVKKGVAGANPRSHWASQI